MAKRELVATDSSEGGNPEGDPKGAPGSGEMTDTSSISERDNLDAAALTSREGATAEGSERAAQPLKGDDRRVETAATAALIDVACGLQDLASKQDELRNLFESRIRSDEVQLKALERLHDQLREYKNNFIRQEMQPLLDAPPPVEPYAPGSWGPPGADRLLAGHGRWHEPWLD